MSDRNRLDAKYARRLVRFMRKAEAQNARDMEASFANGPNRQARRGNVTKKKGERRYA